MGGSAAEVSIVIPTLGLRASLDRCLEALARQRDAPLFEVLLVADAAAADPAALRSRIERSLGRAGSFMQAEVPGASAARNAGWQAARAPVVVFVDDDVVASPGLVACHAALHRAHPDERVGALGPLRWADGLRITPFMRWLEDGIQFDWNALRDRDETGWWHFYTCNSSVKRAALERVGGFDAASFPFLYEDLDLARRLEARLGGLRLRVLHEAAAQHDHAVTLDDWRRRAVQLARSERRYMERYPDAEPWFHSIFTAAAARPAVRGRAARIAGIVPRATPWLGEAVWGHAAEWYVQQLAAPFLEEWDAAADTEGQRAS